MKQNITIKQLDELSDKGRVRLGRWLHPDSQYPDAEVSRYLKQLSIGQMIELLDDHVKDVAVVRDGKWWIGTMLNGVSGEVTSFNDCAVVPEYEERELCDALWEAVKEVLEK